MYLGLDLGTSALKALISDEGGKIITSVSASYNLYHVKNNGVEQNPSDWLKALDEVFIKLKFYLKFVKTLSISGQMHGLVILDKEDNVIRPCILWNDGRTIKENDYLNQKKEYTYAKTANISYAGFTLPKLLWLYNNERDNFNKIAKIMLPKDYILYYLTGNFVSDYTDMAGTLLLDVKDRSYSLDMIKLANIDTSMLPVLKESYELAGYIKEDVALKYGFIKTKVVVGGADNALASLGTNTLKEGTCNISLGTSGTILFPIKKVKDLSSYGLHIFSHVKDSYIMGCILSASSSRKWWLEDILGDDNYLSDEENMSKANTDNLYFLPYLEGERSPHNDPLAKGAIIGLSGKTTRYDISKTILEGVAFALRDSYEIVKETNIDINEMTLCGGGTRSKIMCQIIADVMNVKVKTLANEGPAYGAIILCMIEDNKLSFDDIDKLVKYKDTYLPTNNNYYENKYKYYKKLYPSLKEVFKD